MISTSEQAHDHSNFDELITKDGWTDRLDKECKQIFSFRYLMYHINLCKIDFLIIDVRRWRIVRYSCLKEILSVWILDGIDIDVWCMQSSIFVSFSSKSFLIALNFSLHHTTDCHYITRYARIYQIILYFTLDCLRHLSSVYIINITFNLLYL